MAKKRIHELAKELSLSSAELIDKITEWHLLPEVRNLVASSGLEDYVVDDISRRLGVLPESASAPQVVRRRKKTADDLGDFSGDVDADADTDVDSHASPASSVAEPVASGGEETKTVSTDSPQAAPQAAPMDASEASAPKNPISQEEKPAQTPVRPFKKQTEKATIIAPPAHLLAKDAIKKVPATASLNQPNFKKLPPAVTSADSTPETNRPQETVQSAPKAAPLAGTPSAEVKAEANEAQPLVSSQEPSVNKTEEKQGAGAPPSEAKPVPRKVTRELNEPAAKIISPPRASSGSEPAKVLGTKPVWRDQDQRSAHGGGGRPPFNRPGGQGGGHQGSGQGGGEGGAPRRGGAPGEQRSTANFRPARPAPAAANFAPSVAPEPEANRRRDKKKKSHQGGGGHFEDHDSQRSGRRRDAIERTDLYSEGDWERVRRRGKNAKKVKVKAETTVPKAIKRRIKVDEAISVSELAHRLSIKAGDIIIKLMSMGVMAGVNQALDFDTATLVAAEFGYEVERSSFDEGNILHLEYENSSAEIVRPPVVTIMGHVDHGKTSLLDYIRKTNIQGGEAGGITQHIGAYHVEVGERLITFLDTPGHEAFTAMRSRGAQVTDIVILIVAADDGVMPQTKEAADHAKAAGVPIIVAINKIDKPAADSERVRRELMEIGLVAESWGGDTVFVEISAKTGLGIDDLLEMILLQADILDLKARPDGLARGRIIEARLDKGRGPVATVLVQEGMLKQGDPYVCGVFYGRIRAMLDDQGQRVAEAGPAIPIEIQGVSGVPQAGDEFIVLEDEKQARQVSQHRLLKQRESELTKTSKLTLENLFDNIKAGAIKGLNLIIKTDVQGSLEAICEAVMKLSTSEMKINIIHNSTGSVSETDIMLASASHALIICFGVRPATKVQKLAEAEDIQIRYYDVIYKLIDDIKEAMAGLLDPVKNEKILGRVEVRATFMVTKVGMIAGSYVTDGKILRGARARLLRDGVVIHDGRISSLKRVKDDVREVSSGYECGIGLENYNDIKMGDNIEAYQVEETAATVDLIDEALARAAKDKVRAEKQAALEAENNQDE